MLYTYGYYQQWNFDVQQQFGSGMLLDVAYAGSKGTHLPFGGQPINIIPDSFLSQGESLLTSVANPFYGIVQTGSLSGKTTTAEQLMLPYPQYTGVGLAGQGSADAIYHSLQVQFRKRFAAGATISLAYTWSKLITNTDTITGWLESGGVASNQDWNNLRLDRSLGSFDTPHRLVVSYVLDLPFGKGRKSMNNANRFVDEVLGGWGVEGITTLQSGFPLHFTTAQNNAFSYNNGSQRPNVGAGCSESISGAVQDRLGQYFNTSCFSQPAPFTWGSEGRNDPNLRSPGIANWDFSAYKSFRIREPLTLQFCAECFNVFNRVEFGYPGQTFGTPQFGVVSSQQNLPRVVQFALRASF
jgi:hypothetical protein